ncbi:MAG TPA: hypothetical protein VEZ70_03125 [Allosphingosinicella sp.]|nr:hypothetical protein [Allosphingosinicella sp.]
MPVKETDPQPPSSTPPPVVGSLKAANLFFDLMDEDDRQAIAQAAQELLGDRESLRQVWPGAYDGRLRKGMSLDLSGVELVVVHLDRIGAPAGASGAQVFAAYFQHRPQSPATCEFLPSPPLIIKLGTAEEIEAEHDFIGKWPSLPDDVSPRFALPIAYSGPPERSVLWSPFRSEYRPDPSGHGQRIGLIDLWKPLNSPMTDGAADGFADGRIARLVRGTLDLMSVVHRRNQASLRREKATYHDLYQRYLRKAAREGDLRWGMISSLFGSEESIRRFGREWPNPAVVLSKILDAESEFQGVCGPVHGDLHPKNIVLGRDDTVHIIDFGWSHHNRHVVVDYLLLDLNLRAITLPSHIPEADVLALAGFLKPEDDPKSLPASVASRAAVIRDTIWERALNGEKIVENWRKEYLIPYFLVAYGLLVYLDAARNQDALIATVLAAAKEIEDTWDGT